MGDSTSKSKSSTPQLSESISELPSRLRSFLHPNGEKDLEKLLIGAIRANGGSITLSLWDCDLGPDEILERINMKDPSGVVFRIRDMTEEEKQRMKDTEEHNTSRLHGPGHISPTYSVSNSSYLPSPEDAVIGEACIVCHRDPTKVHVHLGGD